MVSGLVELPVQRDDGSTPIARLCGPGSQICPAGVSGFVAVARLPSRLRSAPKDDYAAFTRDFAEAVALHAPQPAVDKLWCLLLMYQRAFSQARGVETWALPLATADFATALALEMRTVSRSLAELKVRGRIQRKASGLWTVHCDLLKSA